MTNFSRCLARPAAARPRLLRMLAGFETPTEGRILLDGEDIVPGAAAPTTGEHDVPELRVISAFER